MRTPAQYYPFFIAANLLKNVVMFLMPGIIHRIRRTSGTGNPRLDHNCRSVAGKYCRAIAPGDPCSAVQNKTIAELGPGDTVATALFLLAFGAGRVICADRYTLLLDQAKNAAVARQVLAVLPEEQRLRLQAILSFDGRGRVHWDTGRLQYLHTRDGNIPLPDESIDIIVSNAVLEHVQDLDSLFADMHRTLRPGGIMVHAADLKSHGMHRTTALDFLAHNETLWRCMTFYRGAPNRKRKSDYRRLIIRHGFTETCFKVTGTVSSGDIESFRQAFPGRAARFSDEDLSCGGFLFTAAKR